MEIEIRPAKKDDIGLIKELIYSSGPDIYDYLYGDKARDFIEFAYLSGEGFAGYKNVTVAIYQGEVVGTGCFYGLDVHRSLLLGTVANIQAFFTADEIEGVMERSKKVGAVVYPPAEGEVYLSNFGVSANIRGKGIGSKIIQWYLSKAKDQGYTIFGLDVSAKNPKAKALYERLGLTVIEEKIFPDPEAGVNDSFKMEKAI